MGAASRYINKKDVQEQMIMKFMVENQRERETKMIRTIEETIYEDNLKVYKHQRNYYEDELKDLETDRRKIMKRKKIKRAEKAKLLLNNSRGILLYVVRALKYTVQHYKFQYFEDDYYRIKRVIELEALCKTEAQKKKSVSETFNNFLFSPFKDDRLFALKSLVLFSRDEIDDKWKLIESLFFDKIFKMYIMDRIDTVQNHVALELMFNMLAYEPFRLRLTKEHYIVSLFDTVSLLTIKTKRLEKICKIILSLCEHKDVVDIVFRLNLTTMLTQLMDQKYNPFIRQYAN